MSLLKRIFNLHNKLNPDDELYVFLSGKKLYGDDFAYEEIKQWYDEEKEGYANLGAINRSDYKI